MVRPCLHRCTATGRMPLNAMAAEFYPAAHNTHKSNGVLNPGVYKSFKIHKMQALKRRSSV